MKDGAFGAMMQVALVNDGPVTFEFDTAKSRNVAEQKGKDDKKKQWEEKKKKVAQGKKQTGKASEGERTNSADVSPTAPTDGADESSAVPVTAVLDR